ncbi:MAG TPA: cellulase family glycosylhydrolase [Pseudonocardiaceae bacterium]|jgi:endoglucanase|nr:cellulase family glycosylhydrolase [Pseudonocardiaceae bacterium]
MHTVSGKVLTGWIAAGAALLAVGAGVVAVAPAVSAAPSPAAGAGYWLTGGNQILDSTGAPVRIAGINWYGFETPDEVAHGLWSQDYHAVVDDIRNLGYNTIRIPISNQMVEHPVVPQNLSFYNNTGPINGDLQGLTSMQILDKIITYAGQDGLKVIIDNHRSEAGESAEDNGLWYTSTYTNQNWLADWSTVAKRYAGNPTVIGFDLRNEPHTPTGDTYAQGATWGTGDPNTDVRLAYQNAGNAVLAADPNALVFCEGISNTPNASGGFDTTWWGGDLELAGQFPVVLSSPGHVVYSAHDYGPNLFQQTWFNSTTTAASLAAVWTKYWGYLSTQQVAPVWVGEFGTGNGSTDVTDTTAGSEGQWFDSLISYLHANPAMGWTYWALNGEDSYALLDNNYDPTPVSAAKQSLLASLESSLTGTTPPPTTTTITTTATPPTAKCSVAYTETSSWQGGFQAGVTVTNTGSTPITGWTLRWTFPGDQQISNLWNATYTQSGEQVTVTNAAYNTTIAPAGTATIGFTATYSTSHAAPTAFILNSTTC